MFVDVHLVIDQKRYIIPSSHEDEIADRIEHDLFRIRKIRTIHAIEQIQRILLVASEKERKETVLITPIDISLRFIWILIISSDLIR